MVVRTGPAAAPTSLVAAGCPGRSPSEVSALLMHREHRQRTGPLEGPRLKKLLLQYQIAFYKNPATFPADWSTKESAHAGQPPRHRAARLLRRLGPAPCRGAGGP